MDNCHKTLIRPSPHRLLFFFFKKKVAVPEFLGFASPRCSELEQGDPLSQRMGAAGVNRALGPRLFGRPDVASVSGCVGGIASCRPLLGHLPAALALPLLLCVIKGHWI